MHLLVEAGLVNLDDKVSQHWPEFAQNGKDSITIAHVLNHQAGLADAVMEYIAEDPYLAGNDAKILEILASAAPESLPGAETRYHYLTFGWLVDGIVRKVTGKTLKNFITDKVGVPLGIEQELLIGIGENGTNDPIISPRLSTLVLGNTAPTVSGRSQAAERDTHKEDASAKSNSGSSRRRPVGPSIFMNPTFFNDPRIREAAIPAANGHFSARALAKFYHAIATDAFPANESENSPKAPVFSRKGWARPLVENGEKGYATISNEAMLQGGSGSISSGYYIFPLKPKMSAERFLCFGHPGLGGSVAFCRVEGDDILAVAITINRLSLNNNEVTLSIVRSIVEQLQIPFVGEASSGITQRNSEKASQ